MKLYIIKVTGYENDGEDERYYFDRDEVGFSDERKRQFENDASQGLTIDIQVVELTPSEPKQFMRFDAWSAERIQEKEERQRIETHRRIRIMGHASRFRSLQECQLECCKDFNGH